MNDLMMKAADHLAGMKDGAEKNAYALKLFGKGGLGAGGLAAAGVPRVGCLAAGGMAPGAAWVRLESAMPTSCCSSASSARRRRLAGEGASA